jgi:type I restriction-modification system DNA methylase subunit
MIMDEYSVYKMYLALRLHFTTDNYDVIQQKGRVRASRQAYAKRKDLFSIRKIAKSYSDEEVANFLVANFVSGDRWGGMFDLEAGQRYKEWKKRVESLSYNFEQELDNIINDLEESNLKIEDIFAVSKGQHPYIIKAFLRNTISIETLVILERLNKFTERFDREISDTVVWPDVSRLIKKYKPFLLIDMEKYDAIFRRRVGIKNAED